MTIASGTTSVTEPRPQLLVSEIFSAIQGEAALVGERQVFLRLTGCNIRCAYCDQPEALDKRPGPCRIEQVPGRRDWNVHHSPLDLDEVVEAVDHLWRALPHHSVSLTGGEPLMQSRRLRALLPRLADRGHSIMIETNGTLVGGLSDVLAWVAYVSMDVKLPSVDGERVDLDTHRRFLDAALGSDAVTWVKIVVGAATDTGELDHAIAMVADQAQRMDRSPDIFLQPVTPFGGVNDTLSPGQLLELHDRALRRYPRVRVVPQTHKAIGQL